MLQDRQSESALSSSGCPGPDGDESARRPGGVWGRTVVLVALAAAVLVLVVGSIAEIRAQSSGYRSATDSGYGALATRVADASNQTMAQLAAVIESAPSLTNQALPFTARAVLQQGLDAAVGATAQESTQAALLVPPYPSDRVSDQFTRVMAGPGRRHLRPAHQHRPSAGDDAVADRRCARHVDWVHIRSVDLDRSGLHSMGNAGLVVPAVRRGLRQPGARSAGNGCRSVCPGRYGYRRQWPAHPSARPSWPHASGAGELRRAGPVSPAGHHRDGTAPPAVSSRRAGPARRKDCVRRCPTAPGPVPTVLPPTLHGHRRGDRHQLRDRARDRGSGDPDPGAGRPGRDPVATVGRPGVGLAGHGGTPVGLVRGADSAPPDREPRATCTHSRWRSPRRPTNRTGPDRPSSSSSRSRADPGPATGRGGPGGVAWVAVIDGSPSGGTPPGPVGWSGPAGVDLRSETRPIHDRRV